MARLLTALRPLLMLALAALAVAGSYSAHNAPALQQHIHTVVLSPGARYVAMISMDSGTVYEPGGRGRVVGAEGVRHAAFSADERFVALTDGRSVWAVETSTGVERWRAPIWFDWNTRVAFSPEGEHLAALGDRSSTLRLFRVVDGSLLWQRVAHPESGYGLAFAPDGKTLVTGGAAPNAPAVEILQWNCASGDRVSLTTIDRHAYVRDLRFVDAGSAIVVVLSDGDPNAVVSVNDGQVFVADPQHPASMIAGRIAPDESGDRFALRKSDSSDVWTHRYVVATASPGVAPAPTLTTSPLLGLDADFVFASGDGELAVATSAGVVSRWDIASGKEVERIEGLRPSRWGAHWTALLICAGVWLALWGVVLPLGARTATVVAEWVLTIAIATVAFIALFVTHRVAVADPWNSMDPIGSLFGIVALVGLGGPALIIAALAKKAWQSAVLAVAVMPVVFVPAFMALVQTIASV